MRDSFGSLQPGQRVRDAPWEFFGKAAAFKRLRCAPDGPACEEIDCERGRLSLTFRMNRDFAASMFVGGLERQASVTTARDSTQGGFVPVTYLGAVVLILSLVPSMASAEEMRAFSQEQVLVERISSVMSREGPELMELFEQEGVLRGEFLINGRSKASADVVGTATRIANVVRSYFAIPAEYSTALTEYAWVVQRGVLEQMSPARETGVYWRRMAIGLSIDGVPLADAGLSVLFDTEGRARMIAGRIPHLGPELVAAVRTPVVPPARIEATIQADADAQPDDNPFGIVPGEPVPPADLSLLALAGPPYLVYRRTVQAALYTVNARTGAIVGREMATSVEALRIRASVLVRALSRAAEMYRIDNGSYPTSEEGLGVLVSAPTNGTASARNPQRGYIKASELIDPWGGALSYQAPGRVNPSSFDLCSLGPDRTPAGDGPDTDICNYSSGGEVRAAEGQRASGSIEGLRAR